MSNLRVNNDNNRFITLPQILLINLPHLLSSKFIFPCTFTRTVIMNFFKARPKTPGDIAKTLKECLVKLDNGLDNRKRVRCVLLQLLPY